VKAFEELKLGKKSKYIIFTLNDKKSEIIVEKVSLGGDYDDFVEDLPATECRWGVFDLEYKKDGEGEGKRNKLIFVSWSPDGAKIKDKMVTASSRDALRRSLNGIAVEVQATEFSEVAKETVVEKAKRVGN